MYGEIVFYTHGSTIEYGGEIFAAGELTADILNFAPEDYRPIQRLLNRMKELARQYEDTLERGVWWELNNQLIELRSQLMRIIPVLIYDIFHIVPCSLRPPLHAQRNDGPFFIAGLGLCGVRFGIAFKRGNLVTLLGRVYG